MTTITPENPLTFEELQKFVETDVTVPRRATTHANAPQRRVDAPRRASIQRIEKPSRRGRFYRPELFTSWERFTGNIVVRITGWVLLVGGAGTLTVIALTRG